MINENLHPPHSVDPQTIRDGAPNLVTDIVSSVDREVEQILLNSFEDTRRFSKIQLVPRRTPISPNGADADSPDSKIASATDPLTPDCDDTTQSIPEVTLIVRGTDQGSLRGMEGDHKNPFSFHVIYSGIKGGTDVYFDPISAEPGIVNTNQLEYSDTLREVLGDYSDVFPSAPRVKLMTLNDDGTRVEHTPHNPKPFGLDIAGLGSAIQGLGRPITDIVQFEQLDGIRKK